MFVTKDTNARAPYRLLEFYCGIGGIRYAMEATSLPYKSVGAVDISSVVNQIYCHNFGKMNYFRRNIQSFRAEEIDKLAPDIVTMTPPCQPYTRTGLKLGNEDPRSESFLHLLDVFKELERKPPYFFLENVSGFENTCAKDILIKTLTECGYVYQEFLLSPIHCGIPNSRMRYYIIAKQYPFKFVFSPTELVLTDWPNTSKYISNHYPCKKCEKSSSSDLRFQGKCVIKHFLEDQTASFFSDYRLSQNVLEKYGSVLDIVEEDSSTSCCFTRGYGRYVLGTGSVLHPPYAPKVKDMYEVAQRSCESEQDKAKFLQKLELRYFTPQEVANLMCFPSNFKFPESISSEQKYRTLGNSVNVFVVSQLMKILLLEK